MASFHFSHPGEVRYADLNALQQRKNVTYFSYMEPARSTYFEHRDLRHGKDVSSLDGILPETSGQCKRPIRYGHGLRVGASTVEFGRKSLPMKYVIGRVDERRSPRGFARW